MSLSRNTFLILNALREAGPLSQRELAGVTGLSLGSVNATVQSCREQGLIEGSEISDAGLFALQPYKVDNAIIMAAGLSERFAPISYEKPKGMLRVRGEVLIERQIQQLQAAGITDITVVVGYRKEYFFHLIRKYGVTIVVNNEYATRHNNASLWLVRDKLANTYICSSDNYFTENPFEPYVYQAYYATEFVEGPTAEWCTVTGAGGRITDLVIGGEDAWVLLGQAYFDKAFSKRFVAALEDVYDKPETADKLWEAIYLDHIDDLHMVRREFPPGVIYEFDSLDELRGFDPAFLENVDSEIFDNIASTFGCKREDITDFVPLKQGLTNLSCRFTLKGEQYVYRYPGVGSEAFIDRGVEFQALEVASNLGLDSTFIGGDPVTGWKVSRFVQDARPLDPMNDRDIEQAMESSRLLHQSGLELSKTFSFLGESLEYEKLLLEHGPIDIPGYGELRDKALALGDYVAKDGYPLVPSHVDYLPLNFLIDPEGRMSIIDWEFAGMADPAVDFATLVVCGEFPEEQSLKALTHYLGRAPSDEEKRHFWAHIALGGWCWYVWGSAKEASGDDVGEWLYIYYRHAIEYMDRALEAYSGNHGV